jgi:hypothetical protein
MISVLHPRDMEQPVVTLDETNGWFQHKRPLTLRLVKVVSCEGFRALAYESLQCRNPRAPRAALWVNRLWDGSGG